MKKLVEKLKYVKMQDILAIVKWMIALPFAGIFKRMVKSK